jgi:tetratricopeptide (TPR) repeat protein
MNDTIYGMPQRASLPARIWYRFRKLPAWIRWAIVVVLLFVFLGGGVFLVFRQQRNSHRQEINSLQDRLNKVLTLGDDVDALETIDVLLALDPEQPRVVQIRDVLISGVAPPDDPILCALTMQRHLRKPDYTAAAREARKRLVHEPNDWNARCTTITDALNRGQRQEALRELSAMPDPETVGPSATGLLWAYELYQRLGADRTRIRVFVNNTVVPILDTPRYEQLPNATKLSLIECYLLGFDAGSLQRQQTQLRQGVAPSLKLLDIIQRSPEADRPLALQVKLGEVLLRFGNALDILRADDQLTEGRHAELVADVQQRTLDVWGAVQKLAPTEQRAYHGQAVVYIRQKRLPKAFEIVETGLAACEKNDSLVALNSVLYQGTGEPERALDGLIERVKRDPKNLNLWVMIAELGLTLQRPDLALAACEDARNLATDNPVLQLVQIRAHLMRKDPHAAVQIITSLGEGKRMASPALCGAYIRCLCETGLTSGLDQEFDALEKVAIERNQPMLLAAAVVGLAEGPFDVERWANIEKRINRGLEQFPGQRDLLIARALLLFRSVEHSAPEFDQNALGSTKVAVELARAANLAEPSLTAMLVWLHLKGLNQPEEALRAAEPLLLARKRGDTLLPEHGTLLGATLAANKQVDEAVKCLELALAQGSRQAAPLVELARIAQQRNDLANMKNYIDRANRAVKTTLDQAELRKLQPNPTRESP